MANYARYDGEKKYRNSKKGKAVRNRANAAYRSRQTKEQYRERWLKRKYGVSYSQALSIYQSQDGKCAICLMEITFLSTEGKKMANLDHCHRTGKNRGFLCRRCNVGLGVWEDSIEMLNRASDYIRKNIISE